MLGNANTDFLNLEHLGSALGFVEEIQNVVEKLSLFDGFTHTDYCNLCEYMECFGARKNVTLLSEGAMGDFLLILLTGQVEVIKESDAAEKKLVTRVGPGSFIGEMSLIDGQRRFASCITTQPTDFAVLTRHKLNIILTDHPQLGAKLLLVLLQLMTNRLRDATTRMLPTILGEAI
jgi:CRP/FNR family transcriptional regulator, cyclic AMP receptor protein